MTGPRNRSGRGHGQWGWPHQQQRQRWAPVVAAGDAYCAEPVCLMPDRWIPPDSEWHLSHDPTGTITIGPSHARCNLSEAAKRGNRMRSRDSTTERPPTSGRWTL